MGPDTPRDALAARRRLVFPTTSLPLRCSAYLTGLTVALDTDPARRGELAAALREVGATAQEDPNHGLLVPVASLYRLAGMPANIEVEPDLELDVVWQLADRYGRGLLDTPATLAVAAGSGRLMLRWESAEGDTIEGVLSDEAVTALLHSQLPFVASEDAWQAAAGRDRMPVRMATLSLDPDGYVRIEASQPQQVESSPIPGLWRIGQTTYGVPAAYSGRLERIAGLSWSTAKPEPVPAPNVPKLTAERLAGHVEQGARHTARMLAEQHSAVICWPSGLGRRVTALAAVVARDSLPVQIVSPAWAAWPWAASAAAVGLSEAFGDAAAWRLSTWEEVAAGRSVSGSPALILDDFTSPQALSQQSSLEHLADLQGVDRIGVCAGWPEEAEAALAAMHLIRPEEFPSARAGALLRYPRWPGRRAAEHTAAHMVPMPALAAGRPWQRRFDVHTTALSANQRRQVTALCDRHGELGDLETLRRLRRVVNGADGSSISPKASQISGRAVRSAGSGLAVLVVVSEDSVAEMLGRLILRTAPGVKILTWAQMATGVGAEAALHADEILIGDYPSEGEQLWGMLVVGGSGSASTPRSVHLWHATGSSDDADALTLLRGSAGDAKAAVAACANAHSPADDDLGRMDIGSAGP